MSASMNGLLRASRTLVGATEGNRYSAKCMIVHCECVALLRIWVVPQILQSVPCIWDGLLIFLGDIYDFADKTMATFKLNLNISILYI